MKTKKVYLLFSTKSGNVNGCFATKKDANKYIGESQNFLIKKYEVQSYESKKESVITPLGITVNISKQLDNLLTHDLPLSMKYKCLSDISKEIDGRLKEIDNSIGKSTLDRYNFPHTHKKIWDYWSSVLMENNVVFEGGRNSGRTHFYEEWSKQLNEYLKGKGFKNDEPFGMAPIEDVEFELERIENGIMEKYFIVDKKGERTPIAPPLGFNHDFHKQAIEAEKELDKVCINNYNKSKTKHIKYIKKPIEVEAIQLTNSNILEVYRFIHGHDSVKLNCNMAIDKWEDYERIVLVNGLNMKTLESDNETQIASMGDFIIKGIKGEFYPCKPDIFELTYEKVTI